MSSTLRDSMILGGRCCLAWLNPDRDFLPTDGWDVAHDTGRWWDAILRLEAAIGFVIPAELEAAMLRNLQLLTDNVDGLLMNSPAFDGLEAKITPHNFREAMLAFNALVRYRNSEWAREAGLRLLLTLDRCLDADGRLDLPGLQCWGKIPMRATGVMDPQSGEHTDGTEHTGRSLEAIIWFYEATGEPLALDVAERIARYHLKKNTNADGSVRQEIISKDNIGHCHSYLGTLRGLLLYGLLTRQREYIDTVNATYRRGVSGGIMTESGWSPHDLGKIRYPNDDGDPSAESAGCGDAIQLALWLALRDGQSDLLDDVQRLMRCRILASQATELEHLDTPRHERLMPDGMIGSWGAYSQPYAYSGSMLDVVAAVLHTEADVYTNIVTRDSLGLSVNLHFDYVDPTITLTVDRSNVATVRCTPWVQDNILLRVPGWAPADSVQITIDGKPSPTRAIGDYRLVPKTDFAPGTEIVLTHDLPERTTREVMPVSRNAYELRWRGDEVIDVEPKGARCMYVGG